MTAEELDDPADILSIEPAPEELPLSLQLLANPSLVSPKGRQAVARERAVLVGMMSRIKARLNALDTLAKMHLLSTRTDRLYLDRDSDYSIAYLKPKNVYVIKDPEGLRVALGAFVMDGSLPVHDVDEAIYPEVAYKWDNAKLNTLSRRGEAIKQVIDQHRTLEEKDPMTGTIDWPRMEP